MVVVSSPDPRQLKNYITIQKEIILLYKKKVTCLKMANFAIKMLQSLIPHRNISEASMPLDLT